jgi:hypothetical protein
VLKVKIVIPLCGVVVEVRNRGGINWASRMLVQGSKKKKMFLSTFLDSLDGLRIIDIREIKNLKPSHTGGRDQEDQGLRPARANSLRDPILKKKITKKSWWSGSRCRPCVQTLVLPHTQKN